MSHRRRLAVTEEEDFQVWIEKNWDRPLSDEVERLHHELKRLEAVRRADLHRLRKADAAWWSLMRKGFLMCLGLVAGDGVSVGWDRFKVGYLWHHPQRKVVRAYLKYRRLLGQITKSRWHSCSAYKRGAYDR